MTDNTTADAPAVPFECGVSELLLVVEAESLQSLLDTGLGEDVLPKLVTGLTVVVLVMFTTGIWVVIGVVGAAVVVVATTGVCTSAKIHLFQLLFFFSTISFNFDEICLHALIDHSVMVCRLCDAHSIIMGNPMENILLLTPMLYDILFLLYIYTYYMMCMCFVHISLLQK